MLQLHDAEIVQLRNYYEVHKELFEGVRKWEESWRLFLEFERKFQIQVDLEIVEEIF